MNFHEFTTQVISEMRRRFPCYDIQVQEIPKLQGDSYTGMPFIRAAATSR